MDLYAWRLVSSSYWKKRLVQNHEVLVDYIRSFIKEWAPEKGILNTLRVTRGRGIDEEGR